MVPTWIWDNPATRWWDAVTKPPEPVQVPGPWRINLSDWGCILARAVRGASTDDLGMVASSIAFAAFLSILPLLSVVALTYGALVPRAEVLSNVATLATILPKSTQSFVHEWLGKSLARREGHGLALILSIALTLFSARRVGSSLLRGIDIAGGVKQDRDPFAAQAVALVTVAAGALLLFAALVSLSGLAILDHVITGDVPGVAQILHVILWLTLTLGAVTALLLIYRYVPARAAIRWRWAIPGTLVAVAS